MATARAQQLGGTADARMDAALELATTLVQ
jgi:hypothetical protein